MPIDPKLWETVERQFPMGSHSHHGPRHWRRVYEFGKRLARSTGADLEIVELFALFHDSRRMNDAVDPGHGQRGADLALEYHGKLYTLETERLDLLLRACRDHTEGELTDHPTLGTCWDADRLDLWRVGIYPNARFLCTDAAKDEEMIAWAVDHTAPDLKYPG
ncbi:MAG: HD domain-containing protein [Planctomycetota bacterium]|jgi:uncharacterized protein